MIVKKIRSYFKTKKQKKYLFKKYPTSQIDYRSKVDSKTEIEGESVISNSNVCSSNIGLCTVIGQGSSLPNCKIGRFCSISSNVKVQPWTHPTTFVSSYPSFYDTINNYPFGKGKHHFDEAIKTKDGHYAIIGNDVWIGERVIIKGGVSIGDGSIIGMGSIVTKDVPPYAIVCGVPARIIKFRFDEKTIKQLLSIKWWFWDAEIIKARRNDFHDVATFIKKYKK